MQQKIFEIKTFIGQIDGLGIRQKTEIILIKSFNAFWHQEVEMKVKIFKHVTIGCRVYCNNFYISEEEKKFV